jgi:hypothetical protein
LPDSSPPFTAGLSPRTSVTEADEQRRSDPSARTIRRSARDYATVTVMAAAVPANEWLVDGLEAAPASRRERF